MLCTNLRTAVLAAGAAATLTACAPTPSFHSSWRNPAAQTLTLGGRKVAALVLHESEAVRYTSEDTLAREIAAYGGQGVPVHTLLPRLAAADREPARAALERAQVDGVVALRAVAWEKASSGNLGTYWGAPKYASFWESGLWGGGFGSSTGGDLRADAIVVVEVLVYSLSENKLMWACHSETMNPSNVGPYMRELSTKVGTEMERQGLLAGPTPVSAVGFRPR